ncbi:MAG: DUF4368 domain-containing protein [Lachnospiraceae bacterium]|nr:DUF4368 domain-containing protein [Lachnospiraceae bacterium]
MEATQEDEQATDEWLAVIRDYALLEELDRPTLLRLVKRIEVGEKYEIAGETHRDISIFSAIHTSYHQTALLIC